MTTSIEVMKDLEHIRARHTMYTDSVDHATKEAIDNVIDEYQADACSYLGISLDTQTNQVIIADNGRGIPIDIHETEKLSKLAVVFTKLHSSGKYKNREINNYNTTIGLNGVGVKVTSATSELFEAWTTKKNKTYKVVVDHGVLRPTADAGIIKEKFPPLPFQQTVITTVLRYTPDPTVYGAKYCQVSPDYLRDLCSSLQHLCPSLHIELIIDGERKVFVSTMGIIGLLEPKGIDIECKRFHINNSDLNLVLWWNPQEDGEVILSYVNCQKTKDGGTHVNALKTSITEAFGETGRSISPYLKEGLRCAFHLRIADPQFQGQNKHRLLNPEASDLINKNVTRNLELFLAENPKIRDAILQRAVALKKAHETYKKDRDAIKNLNAKSKARSISLPDKLISAPGCLPEQRELYICEGQSASGPIIKARTRPLYQEVFMLKGKITNSCRAEMGKVLANPDIIGIIQSIGCGILDDCDPKKARVGKVLLISDADSDGRHIDALLTAFFITYMSPMVEDGRIYRVKSPLYVASYREQHWYGKGISDASALADMMTKIPENLKSKIGKKDGITLTRFKGHGAASAEAIRDYALGPKRDLEMIRLPLGDADIVASLMGDDVQARKELLAIDW